jgi:hypothetical protein
VSALETFKREVRIATSRRAQPVWFRILKWAITIGISAIVWRTPYFFWWIFGALGLSWTLHFFWRWKTKSWTQPWGGWDDLEAQRGDRARDLRKWSFESPASGASSY